ncbi:hypothetical protein JCM16303_005052 [Sporobolomyces ruberrimus]
MSTCTSGPPDTSASPSFTRSYQHPVGTESLRRQWEQKSGHERSRSQGDLANQADAREIGEGKRRAVFCDVVLDEIDLDLTGECVYPPGRENGAFQELAGGRRLFRSDQTRPRATELVDLGVHRADPGPRSRVAHRRREASREFLAESFQRISRYRLMLDRILSDICSMKVDDETRRAAIFWSLKETIDGSPVALASTVGPSDPRTVETADFEAIGSGPLPKGVAHRRGLDRLAGTTEAARSMEHADQPVSRAIDRETRNTRCLSLPPPPRTRLGSASPSPERDTTPRAQLPLGLRVETPFNTDDSVYLDSTMDASSNRAGTKLSRLKHPRLHQFPAAYQDSGRLVDD